MLNTKKIITITLAIVFALSLAACAKEISPDGDKAGTTQEEVSDSENRTSDPADTGNSSGTAVAIATEEHILLNENTIYALGDNTGMTITIPAGYEVWSSVTWYFNAKNPETGVTLELSALVFFEDDINREYAEIDAKVREESETVTKGTVNGREVYLNERDDAEMLVEWYYFPDGDGGHEITVKAYTGYDGFTAREYFDSAEGQSLINSVTIP